MTARRLVSVTDSATKCQTTYTYDVAGNRKHETVRAPDFAGTVGTARNMTYALRRRRADDQLVRFDDRQEPQLHL